MMMGTKGMGFGFGYVYQVVANKSEDWGEDKACMTVRTIIEMGRAEEADPLDIITAIEEYIEWELDDNGLEHYIKRANVEPSNTHG